MSNGVMDTQRSEVMDESTKAATPLVDDELWRPARVAQDLGVTENTLAIWRFHNQGPTYLKIGRQVRYEAKAVQDFKDACKHECSPRIGRFAGRRP